MYKATAEKDVTESRGYAVSQARAKSEKLEIESKNKVETQKLQNEANAISRGHLDSAKQAEGKVEYENAKRNSAIQMNEKQQLAAVEVNKIQKLLNAVGSDTLATILNAEPQMQQEMLKSLGLQGYLMTDGRNPINLFDTAQGLVTQQTGNAGGFTKM